MTTTPTASPELPDLDRLRQIGNLIATQDNRITDQPIFIVQQRRRVYGFDTDYCENFIWVCSEDDYSEASAEEAAELEAEYQKSGRVKSGWQRTGYTDQWEFVTACFTEQGCKDYLERDGHNLKEPRIYAEGSYRNEEFRAVRDSLIALARRAKPEGEAPQAELHVEARECSSCGHVGINDSSDTLAACHNCDWSGPSPAEDHCPGCAQGSCMGAACPRCGAIYKLLVEADIAAPAAQHAESGAPDIEAAFAEFCDREGYPSDGPMDEALRAAFREGAALAAQSQGAPAPRIIGGQRWSKEAEMTEGWIDAQQAAAPGALALLNTDELAALRRFYETCQDGEGYDVPKAMMQRLAEIGVVRRTSGSYYETTEFGLRVLHQPAPSTPGTLEAPKGGAA